MYVYYWSNDKSYCLQNNLHAQEICRGSSAISLQAVLQPVSTAQQRHRIGWSITIDMCPDGVLHVSVVVEGKIMFPSRQLNLKLLNCELTHCVGSAMGETTPVATRCVLFICDWLVHVWSLQTGELAESPDYRERDYKGDNESSLCGYLSPKMRDIFSICGEITCSPAQSGTFMVTLPHIHAVYGFVSAAGLRLSRCQLFPDVTKLRCRPRLIRTRMR